MKIAEIFYSVQGEGSLVGVPSVFIRTSGCNLRCVWCDTPYTSWNPEGSMMTVAEILEQALASGARHAVVTGGEPMIAPRRRNWRAGCATPDCTSPSRLRVRCSRNWRAT